ncbi:hypothetical protein ACIQMJ_21045 [Actinosynnema sp. NPDC091369]
MAFLYVPRIGDPLRSAALQSLQAGRDSRITPNRSPTLLMRNG